MASVTVKEGDVEVRIDVVASGKPIDHAETKRAANVELLRREVRAWRRQQQATEHGASKDTWDAILRDRDIARLDVDSSGALG